MSENHKIGPHNLFRHGSALHWFILIRNPKW
jgi:hypothetical protein